MRTDTSAVWAAADEAFRHADEAFAEADKIFRKAPPAAADEVINGEHTLRFAARTVNERWTLICKFFGMGWSVLFTGKTSFIFRKKAKA